MIFRRLLSVLAGCAFLVIPGVVAAQTADQVVVIPGSTLKPPGGRYRGAVVSESPIDVKITLGANTQAVPIDQIAQIIYAGTPATVARAESRENAGALGEAAELYRQAATEAAGKQFIVAYCQFSQARLIADIALADPTRVNDAINLLETFSKANATSRHIIPATEFLARLHLLKGNADAAGKAIDSLAKYPSAADKATVLKAKVLAKKGDHAGAIAIFDKIITASADGSVKKREGRLAKAESLAALMKYDEATKLLEDVIQSSPPEDFVAQSAAYNTLGDCLKAAGKPKEALYAYLHTDVLYGKDKEHHPRALAQIAQLWKVLKRDDRAEEVLERLKQEYPQSPYNIATPK